MPAKPIQLWHIMQNYVEVDNTLPIIHAIAKHLPHIQQRVLLLHPNRDPVSSPLTTQLLGEVPLLLPHEFLRGPTWAKWITSLLARWQIRKKDYRKLIMKLFRFDEEQFNSCDYLLITANTLSTVTQQTSTIPTNLLDKLHPLVYDKIGKIFVYTEAYDQFHELLEFFNFDFNFTTQVKQFLSRGDPKKIDPAIPTERLLAIGTPRYSGYWIDHITRLAHEKLPTPLIRGPKQGVVLLFLPSKASRLSFEGLDLSQDDQMVFSLLDQFKDLRVIIKPHPKTKGRYQDFNRMTPHGDRVTLFQNDVDSATLAAHADLMVTSGTSFVPHFLWLGKPVVLLGEWSKQYAHTMMYADFCYQRAEIFDMIQQLQAGKPIPTKISKTELANIFQLGRTTDFESHLVHQLANTIQ